MAVKTKNKVPRNCKVLMTHIAECELCVVGTTQPLSPTQTVGSYSVTGASWFVQLCKTGVELGRGWWNVDE